MLFKSVFSRIRDLICCPWFFSNKLFFHLDVITLFEGSYMTGQITISNIQQFLERIKINAFIYTQHRHNAKPDSAIKNFVKIIYVEILFHLSYLKCITTP